MDSGAAAMITADFKTGLFTAWHVILQRKHWCSSLHNNETTPAVHNNQQGTKNTTFFNASVGLSDNSLCISIERTRFLSPWPNVYLSCIATWFCSWGIVYMFFRLDFVDNLFTILMSKWQIKLITWIKMC